MYDLAIVGAGPAGLSAAIYAARAELNAVTLERVPIGGGQINTTESVDNYPGLPGVGGMELAQRLHKHAVQAGAEIQTADIQNLHRETAHWNIASANGPILTRTVIMATGATHRKMDVPGEEQFFGRGVSYCATCDGAFFRGKTVAVVGGGDVAVGDAILLSKLCKQVYLVHRRDSLKASAYLQSALRKRENVEMVWNTVVEEVCGSQKLEKINVRPAAGGQAYSLAVDGVFVAIGLDPNSRLVEGIASLDYGYIRAGEDCVTSAEGIFAAGDVRTKPLRQIVTAVADGASSVQSVERYLHT